MAHYAALDMPFATLVGQIFAASALLSSKIVKGATLKVYPGAPHGLTFTHKEQFNADLLAFLRS